MFWSDFDSANVPAMVAQSYARALWPNGRFYGIVLLELEEGFEPDRVPIVLESVLRAEDTALWRDRRCLLLLLEGHRHTSDSLRLARRLQRELPVSRIGIAGGAKGYGSGLEMLDAAQRALDSAGSDRQIRYASAELRREAEYRIQFEDELTTAVRTGGLVPYYQPIIDLPTGDIRGFEALVRWQHPTAGLLLPDSFLEIARELDLLSELDRFILEESLRQLETWVPSVSRPLRVNVNLSPHHFLTPGGLEHLITIVDRHRDVAKMLRVDISEEVLRHERGLASLYALQGLKVGFHLDDFGVSFESFRCLTAFPFDSLKVDRTLIAEMEEEVNAELIIAVLRIAQRMKIRTTAEGLVTHAQLEELRQLGCDEAQGFLFSPAISAEGASEFLRVGPRW